MAVEALRSGSASPIAFAQAVVDEKNVNAAQAAQAILLKKQIEGNGKVANQLIKSATDSSDGRKLLATA